MSPSAWALHIGGYPVCESWLKHRKGRELDFEELEAFRSIVAAATVTVETVAAIDESLAEHRVFPSRGGKTPKKKPA